MKSLFFLSPHIVGNEESQKSDSSVHTIFINLTAITTLHVPSAFCILLSYCYLYKLKKGGYIIKKLGHMGPSFTGLQ